MANEYLKRTPTSTGNRKVWTWSGWFKLNDNTPTDGWAWLYNTSVNSGILINFDEPNYNSYVSFYDNGASQQVISEASFRDPSSWYHLVVAYDSTLSTETDRIKFFMNGVRLETNSSLSITYPTQNLESSWNDDIVHSIGRWESGGSRYIKAQYLDQYFIDGQALTPDVFGKYDEGKGYISAGTTQATDFKKGQWIPKAPAIIKSVINARGGFGVNGFYLPMNSANNYGADFHTTPNSILKLKENLPQPKAEIDGAGDYTNALRDDPFKDYLVLAIPGVSGGLQNGFGDYSAAIRGSGTNKVLTASGNAGVAVTASYYGSALSFDGSGDSLQGPLNSSDLEMGSDDFTVEAWINPSDVSGPGGIAGVWDGSSNDRSWLLYHGTGGGINFIISGNGISSNVAASGISMTTGQWYHAVGEKEGTTIRIIVNGVVAGINTSASASVYDSSEEFRIGVYDFSDGTPDEFNGYIQDVRVYKGIAKYKGGFDVPKPYTPINFANWRAVPDTTANNFATFNPLLKLGSPIFSFSDGNLKVIESGNLGGQNLATMGVSSGKWYYEVRWAGIVSSSHISGWSNFSEYNVNKSAWCRSSGQTSGDSGGGLGTFPVASNGDIINVAFDADSGKLWFGINGTYYSSQVSTTSLSEISQGNDPAVIIYTTGSGIRYFPIIWYDNVAGAGKEQFVNFGQNPSIGGNYTPGTFTDSNGKGLFKYEPPSGFLALCEDNLPTPAIKNPGEHFKTVLWTGDGNNGRSITGVGFKPDFVWIKRRLSGNQAHAWHDSVRGPTIHLESSTTDGDETNNVYGALNSFDNDGFSIALGSGGGGDYVNTTGNTYVAWCWKAGGPAITNTDGTITSQVSANQDAGFSIVSYTGTISGSAPTPLPTVGHGLGVAPQFVIGKSRNNGGVESGNWFVWHASAGTDNWLRLNTTVAAASISVNGGGTMVAPTSTVFSTPYISGSNISGNNYVAYCWAEIEGFSKFGSYVGNGNADGPFVYCGFKPAWIIFKRSDASGGWVIKDSSRKSTNPQNSDIFANTFDVESDVFDCDFLSNGFKLRDTTSNTSGGTYIFAAFAESPFQTANAK